MNKFYKYMPLNDFPAKVGYAVQFSLSRRNNQLVGVFEMAPQNKKKPLPGSKESVFDWTEEGKIFIMLDELEFGNILSSLTGKQQEVKIIHKFPMDGPVEDQKTTSMTLAWSGSSADLAFSMEQKRAGEQKWRKYKTYLQPNEVEILRVLVEQSIGKMYAEFFTPEIKTYKAAYVSKSASNITGESQADLTAQN